jgi:hypothetical protein
MARNKPRGFTRLVLVAVFGGLIRDIGYRLSGSGSGSGPGPGKAGRSA